MMYRIRRPHPMHRAMAMHRAMNQMMDDADLRRGPRWAREQFARVLPVDLYETDDALVLETALPGFEPDAVDITINRDELTIKATRPASDDAPRSYHLRERPDVESVERVIALPDKIDANAAEAVFKNGVLTLTLPKAEETKPKRVSVTAK